MIDNIILLLTGTLHNRPIAELMPKCHPLGSFTQMEAVTIASTVDELYSAVLVDTPLGISALTSTLFTSYNWADSLQCSCFECFDTVGWASGRGSGLSDGVLTSVVVCLGRDQLMPLPSPNPIGSCLI